MKKLLLIILVFSFVSCQETTENTTEIDNTTETIGQIIPEEIEFIPMEMNFTSSKENEITIPKACDFEGSVVSVHTWKDLNGENFFIQTIEESKMTDGEYYQLYAQNLHAYHYTKTKDEEVILVRELLDFIKDCEFDYFVEHLPSVVLTDKDEDNYGEVLFGYRLACRSDVSSSEQKVVLFENGDKYILRGFSEVIGYGGDFEAGSEFLNAPNGFLKEAEAYWEINKVELDIPEGYE